MRLGRRLTQLRPAKYLYNARPDETYRRNEGKLLYDSERDTFGRRYRETGEDTDNLEAFTEFYVDQGVVD